MNFKEITIRDILAITFSFGVFMLLAFKVAVPDQIWSALILILTFFFTQKPGTTTTTPDLTNKPTS